MFYFNYISLLPTLACCSEKEKEKKKKKKISPYRPIKQVKTLLCSASEQKGEIKMLSSSSVFQGPSTKQVPFIAKGKHQEFEICAHRSSVSV